MSRRTDRNRQNIKCTQNDDKKITKQIHNTYLEHDNPLRKYKVRLPFTASENGNAK